MKKNRPGKKTPVRQLGMIGLGWMGGTLVRQLSAPRAIWLMARAAVSGVTTTMLKATGAGISALECL